MLDGSLRPIYTPDKKNQNPKKAVCAIFKASNVKNCCDPEDLKMR